MFFAKNHGWAELYGDRALGIALCQGAALHHVNPNIGINDFDVYTFYAAHPGRRWYAKRIQSVDFGDSKFGRSEVTKLGFTGRRVDLMGRTLGVPVGTQFGPALRAYLTSGLTRTARELAGKAVVILEPRDQLGTIVWP